MLTIIETATFQRRAKAIWTTDEYEDFIAYIALHPDAGAVVPGTGGIRKLRWRSGSKGKRGGVRIMYFCNRTDELWLITLYAKHQRENMSAADLARLRRGIDGSQ